MEMPAVFTRYDVRGEYPSEINEEFALKFGKTIGTFAKKKIVVGFDTRQFNRSLKCALVSGILSTGIDVVDVGLSPTDKVALAGKHYNADFSVMITASHHNWTRSGFKLMYCEGNGFSNEDMAKIKDLFMSSCFRIIGHKSIGLYSNEEEEFNEIYIARAINVFNKYFDKIDATVVVDCCNGGASVTTPIILERLGAKVICVNCNKTPDFLVNPEPQACNRKNLVEIMDEHNADIVVGHDPDADRIFAYDSKGIWISGDEIFCIVSGVVSAKKIVASLDTSSMLEDVTGAEVIYTPVGDIFVSKKAREVNADFCGEPNGHYAVPDFCLYNSGTFVALILAAMSKDILSIKSSFPKYYFLRRNLEFSDAIQTEIMMKKIVDFVRSNDDFSIISDADGIKFLSSGCTCFARSSGTFPVIRIVSEGKDKKKVKHAFEKLLSFIECLGD